MFQAKFKISRPVQINRPQQPKQLQQQPLDGIPFSQGQSADVSTLDAFGQALHAQIVLKGGSVRAAAVLVPKAFGVRLPPVPGRVSLKAYILENALHFYWNKHAFRTGEHIQVITPSAGTESSAQNGAGNGTALVYTPEPRLVRVVCWILQHSAAFLNIVLGWFIGIHFVKLWLRWPERDEVVVEHEVCKRVCVRGRGREGWRGRVCERVDLKDCIYARREH